MSLEFTHESNAHLLSPGKEFRDTRMVVKYVMGGIATARDFSARSRSFDRPQMLETTAGLFT